MRKVNFYVFVCTFLYLPVIVKSQTTTGKVYATLQAVGYSTENVFAGGPQFSFGYAGNNFAIGPGVGLIILGEDKPYIPLYLSMMYSGSKKKLSPMGSFHMGKGFYKGTSRFLDDEYYLINAGFYGQVDIGLAIRIRSAKIHVMTGVTLMSFTAPGQNKDINETLFNVGLGFFGTN